MDEKSRITSAPDQQPKSELIGSPNSIVQERIIWPEGRPFRISFSRGPDPKRIYVIEASRFHIRRGGPSDPWIAELRLFKKLGLRNLSLIFLMSLLGTLIGMIAILLHRPEVGWIMIAVGLLGSLLMGTYLISDYVQACRLPGSIARFQKNRSAELFDGSYSVALGAGSPDDSDSKPRLRLQIHGPRHRPEGQFQELDLIIPGTDKADVFPLMATAADHQGRGRQLAERLAVLAELPLQVVKVNA